MIKTAAGILLLFTLSLYFSTPAARPQRELWALLIAAGYLAYLLKINKRANDKIRDNDKIGIGISYAVVLHAAHILNLWTGKARLFSIITLTLLCLGFLRCINTKKEMKLFAGGLLLIAVSIGLTAACMDFF